MNTQKQQQSLAAKRIRSYEVEKSVEGTSQAMKRLRMSSSLDQERAKHYFCFPLSNANMGLQARIYGEFPPRSSVQTPEPVAATHLRKISEATVEQAVAAAAPTGYVNVNQMLGDLHRQRQQRFVLNEEPQDMAISPSPTTLQQVPTEKPTPTALFPRQQRRKKIRLPSHSSLK